MGNNGTYVPGYFYSSGYRGSQIVVWCCILGGGPESKGPPPMGTLRAAHAPG